MGAVISCLKGVARTIGNTVMAVIRGIANIVTAIINGVVSVCGIVVSFLTCRRGGHRGRMTHGRMHRHGRVV